MKKKTYKVWALKPVLLYLPDRAMGKDKAEERSIYLAPGDSYTLTLKVGKKLRTEVEVRLGKYVGFGFLSFSPPKPLPEPIKKVSWWKKFSGRFFS